MTSKGQLKEKCRYFNAVQINPFYELVEEMADDINDMGFINRPREISNKNIFTYCAISKKDGFTKTKLPQFCFLFVTTKKGRRTRVFFIHK